ncbi:MAG: hypothetical protein CMQ29_16115 [Gammaproteobacteria bacterium]|nr:hypothetical protein [Gammaproteobacteria bacterium]MBF69201.1 hypothetical protein [Gammaproteobacteria bacterium]
MPVILPATGPERFDPDLVAVEDQFEDSWLQVFAGLTKILICDDWVAHTLSAQIRAALHSRQAKEASVYGDLRMATVRGVGDGRGVALAGVICGQIAYPILLRHF